jgi:hypothetical protein
VYKLDKHEATEVLTFPQVERERGMRRDGRRDERRAGEVDREEGGGRL